MPARGPGRGQRARPTAPGSAHARPGLPLHPRRPGEQDAPVRHLAPGTGEGPSGRPRRSVLVAGSVAVAVLLASAVALLSGDDEPRRQTASPASPAASTRPPDPAAAPPVPRSPSPAVQAALDGGRTTTAVRVALEQLFAGRAVAMTRVLHAALQDEQDRVPAAEAALTANTDDLAAVAQALRSPDSSQQLRSGLTQQATAAVDYARAVGTGDRSAAGASSSALTESSARLGQTLAGLSGGRVPATAPQQDAVRLRAYVDALAAGDHARAYALDKQLHAQMAGEGAGLAAAVSDRARPAAQSPAQAALASRWQLLFGAHAALAGEVVRAGLTGAPEFPVAARALDANTGELAAAVGSALGPQQAQAFSARWADSVDAVVGYATATAAQDEAGRAAARNRLTASSAALASFFSTATGGRLQAQALQPAFQRHGDQLVQQADAWARADFPAAYAAAEADYASLASVGAPAASAVAAVVAARAPVGGAATGGLGAGPQREAQREALP